MNEKRILRLPCRFLGACCLLAHRTQASPGSSSSPLMLAPFVLEVGPASQEGGSALLLQGAETSEGLLSYGEEGTTLSLKMQGTEENANTRTLQGHHLIFC